MRKKKDRKMLIYFPTCLQALTLIQGAVYFLNRAVRSKSVRKQEITPLWYGLKGLRGCNPRYKVKKAGGHPSNWCTREAITEKETWMCLVWGRWVGGEWTRSRLWLLAKIKSNTFWVDTDFSQKVVRYRMYKTCLRVASAAPSKLVFLTRRLLGLSLVFWDIFVLL